MLGIINADVCKTFACGDIEGGKEAPCVKKEGEKAFPVRKCEEERTCAALGIPSPETVTSDYKCEDIPPPTKNITVPGDMCKNTTECFGVEGEVSCNDDGVCATTRDEGATCASDKGDAPDHRWCTVGKYCAKQDDSYVCVDQPKEGEACSADVPCLTGFACYSKGEETDPTCQKWYAIENGDKVNTLIIPEERTIFLATADVCKSHNYITLEDNTIECRNATFNVNATELEDLRVEKGAGVTCNVTAYDDPEDPTKQVPKEDVVSQCGFNKDSAGWCKMQKGDKWFTDTLGKVQESGVSGLVCHASSTIGTCKAALDGLGEPLAVEWVRKILSVTGEYGYALYANNDNCVAASITNQYWQDKSPDFGLNFNMASISTLMVTICALFYLF